MMTLTLQTGRSVMFDAADWPLLKGYAWREVSFVNRERGYATSRRRITGRKAEITNMSRLIMGAGPGEVVDHINGNTLDNRRSNLRVCTQTENMKNKARPKSNSTGFKGVYLRTGNPYWDAQIQNDRKFYRVGSFRSPIVAAVAYDMAATILHGEFSRLNFSADRDWILPPVPAKALASLATLRERAVA